jgi:hypothetical protein
MRAILLMILIGGCTSSNGITETGNPELEMSYRARTSAPEAVSLDGSTAPITVQEAWVNVDDVRFVQGTCDEAGEIEIDVPGLTADLLADPAAVKFDATEGDYCRVRVRLDRADVVPDGGPADLSDNSLVILGTRADGVPFTLVSRERPEADVRSRGDAFPLSDAHDRLVMAFDLGKWFEGIDLSAADGDTNIRIDDHNNEGLLATFEASVDRAMSLWDDADGDAEIGDDEDEIASSDDD